MPLSSDSRFGVQAMTDAINALPVHPTQIRSLGLFTPKSLTTTHVDVEHLEGTLKLVQSKERGLPGEPVASRKRNIRTFKIPHLPVDDVIRADEVQNVRAFGGTNAQTVDSVVNDKLADSKSNLEYTREHMQLGALQGKILDANGDLLYDIYDEFKIQRQVFNWKLGTADTKVGAVMDDTSTKMRKHLKGEFLTKWLVLCSPEFMAALKYHDSIKELYERYRDGAAYREANENQIMFEHNGYQFMQYDGEFGAAGAKITAGEGLVLPLGTRSTFAEYFAPADMNATVNTKALPYYASREKLPHDKGWSIHTQSNPLPLVLRPGLVATVKA